MYNVSINKFMKNILKNKMEAAHSPAGSGQDYSGQHDADPSEFNIDNFGANSVDPKLINKSRKVNLKQVNTNVKKMSGEKNKKIKSSNIMPESIRKPEMGYITADYEVRDGDDEELVGIARVTDNVIHIFGVKDDVVEDYAGHIYNKLLQTICQDANNILANLSIQIEKDQMLFMKTFLERFGFRHVGKNIFKRNAGAIIPPSVSISKTGT